MKISQTSSEKGHPRNISMKSFQNLTRDFREGDFLRISSFPYSESSPHSLAPCLMTDQNFLTISETGYSWNISVKSFQNLTCGFREDFFKEFLHVSKVQEDSNH